MMAHRKVDRKVDRKVTTARALIMKRVRAMNPTFDGSVRPR